MFFKIFLILFFSVASLHSDIIRPAYLEIIQKSTNSYAVLLKVPMQKDKTTSLKVKDIEGCREQGFHTKRMVNGSSLDRVTLTCTQSLNGKIIDLQGLENTKMDVLLRLEFLDNTSQSKLLNSLHHIYTVKEDASSMQIIQTYTWLGITHILMGFDHLMFVFALLLIVKSVRRLLWTITAFTLAHSITMAGATLGWVHIPQQPVEAIIALSILFLAMEIMHEKQGKVGLASRYPWMIAFIFGLLHGFGFAGALAEIGLPEQAITLALIFFNIGVELGQLMFVATVVLVALLIQRLNYPKFMERVEMFVVYMIGGISAFWMIERIVAF